MILKTRGALNCIIVGLIWNRDMDLIRFEMRKRYKVDKCERLTIEQLNDWAIQLQALIDAKVL